MASQDTLTDPLAFHLDTLRGSQELLTLSPAACQAPGEASGSMVGTGTPASTPVRCQMPLFHHQYLVTPLSLGRQ